MPEAGFESAILWTKRVESGHASTPWATRTGFIRIDSLVRTICLQRVTTVVVASLPADSSDYEYSLPIKVAEFCVYEMWRLYFVNTESSYFNRHWIFDLTVVSWETLATVCKQTVRTKKTILMRLLYPNLNYRQGWELYAALFRFRLVRLML